MGRVKEYTLTEEQRGFGPTIARRLIDDFLSTSRDHIRFTPEYSKRHFFFTVPTINALTQRPPRRLIRDRHELINEQAQIAEQIISASPQTICTVFVDSESELPGIRDEFFRASHTLREHHAQGRLDFQVGYVGNSRWAQDLGESVGRITQTPQEYQAEFILPSDRPIAPHNPDRINLPTVVIPLHFEGGDITTASVNGENVVILGPRALHLTRSHYQRIQGYNITDEDIISILRHAFSADRVILLTNPASEMEPVLAPHIDQLITFPRPGLAVMLDPNSISEDGGQRSEIIRVLHQYRYQLRQAGFRIITIPTNDSHTENFQSYTNAIPITDTETGRTLMIIPSFGDRAIESQIRIILEQEGIDVRFVRNRTFNRGGNTHCITGALARADNILLQNLSALIPRRNV
ncbi:agmatine deiminase family protein [Candidatus Micrarchaeota archaeon]|nr:agmatine deiminase family protein [Candidatus Micrarchaeota archaeon]MBU1166558.1 agmatine deiminase family protein [Candidatus Micrarchaeota archaeon]MBU1886472.1 agmatine deiminase family protein [Candidatus Micrarchaeota archaeon]